MILERYLYVNLIIILCDRKKYQYLSKVTKYFSPKIVTDINDVFIKVAKIKGEKIPWLVHEQDDELFFVFEGSLKMEIENQDSFIMKKGDIYVVKKGISHSVSYEEECQIILIEGKGSEHTGKVEADITKSIEEQKF